MDPLRLGLTVLFGRPGFFGNCRSGTPLYGRLDFAKEFLVGESLEVLVLGPNHTIDLSLVA